jgi:hypothetical protein
MLISRARDGREIYTTNIRLWIKMMLYSAGCSERKELVTLIQIRKEQFLFLQITPGVQKKL